MRHQSDIRQPPDSANFEALVHDALAHLYDQVFLQRSPLLTMLGQPTYGGGVALHRLLIETVEGLKPPHNVCPDSMAWKTYRTLFLRYVRALSAGGVAAELGLSTRQAQRVHSAALETVAEVLRRRCRDSGPDGSALSSEPLPAMEDDASSLDNAIASILAEDHGELEPLAAILRGAWVTLAPILDRRGVAVNLAVDDSLRQRSAPRVLTRQAIVELCLAVLDLHATPCLHLLAEPKEDGALLTIASFDDASRRVTSRELRWDDRRVSVACRILEAVGGAVCILGSEQPENGLGPRMRVEVTLPLARARTVLVVEDNPQVIQLFRRYLSGSRFQIVSVHDPDEALRVVQDVHPDVISLDVMMPHRDGWELLQAIKVHPLSRGTPVVVCSVLRERDLALALGASEFITKPVTQSALLAALNVALPS